ncbi:hypothetical protein ACKWTF_016587 [Chironomus riparius]
MDIEEIIIGTFLNLAWCGISVYIMCSCLIFLTIRLRLSIINRIATKSLPKADMKMISSLHMNLCELASENGRIFAFQLAFISGVSLVNSTFCFFELYFAIKEHAYGVDLFFSIFATIFNLFFIGYVALIMGTASIMTNEGEKILAVFHKGIFKQNWTQKTGVLGKFHVFLLQIQHSNVNISCGLYKLEWKVMMKVIDEFELKGNFISIYNFNFLF